MKTFGGVVASGFVLVLMLTGCGDVNLATPSPTVSASASPSPSDSASASPSATLPLEMTPAQAKAAYKRIAQASCSWAQRDGVAEVGAGYTAVMTNSAQAYKGFTEASFIAPDAYNVLFDLSDFHACADWYLFSMADEAGKAAPLNVTFNSTDASFNVRKVLASGLPSALKIVVADGVIATATNLDPADPWIIGCRYGSLTAADLAIVKTAVDRRAASQ